MYRPYGIGGRNLETRIKQIRNLLHQNSLDGILIEKPENRRYVAGFTGTTGSVLITRQEALFFTDFRYTVQAKQQCNGYKIIEISRTYPLTDALKELDLNRLGIEEDYMTYGKYIDYKEKLTAIELVPLKGALIKLRSIKSQEEIELIQRAASIADDCFSHILSYIKPGMRELEIALEIEYFMKKRGASGLSFESIVASGQRSSLPHGVASDKIVEAGDLITLDFGCIFNGYCSDMTRSFVLGQATEKQKEIYHIVLEAQEAALKAVAPGIKGKELDQIARDIIKQKGYGEFFGHGLGHGVGLEIHELPHVNSLGEIDMEPGMVITIEPGIYIPEFGGVRIEDLVVVTESGFRVLSKSKKNLLELQV